MKQTVIGQPHRFAGGPRPAQRLLLALCAVSLWTGALGAAEVYTWTDENGVVHYSQTPRPQGGEQVLEVEEAYKPGSVPAQPPAVAGGEETGEPAEATLTAAQARRQQLEEKRAANRERQELNQELCGLHRQRLEQLEPARRVFYTDESGETVRMDDDQRIALVEESRSFVEENCAD
jgi:hypothetical protein